MRVIVDGFGGDNAPLAVLEGCNLALESYDVEIAVVGDEAKIREAAEKNGVSLDRLEIVHAPDVLTMEDEPTDILKAKSNSSMAVGMKMLRQGEGDAFVSGGNTGALVVGASSIVKRIKGIKRAALATQVPTRKSSYMLLDVGANAECRPEMLTQFGIMGSAYMEGLAGIKSPRVGLINNGTEEHKGTPLVKEAHHQMKKAPINFIGNVEARELNSDGCDVAVCDGFTGNIVLKLTEGMANALMGIIKDALMASARGKIGGLLIKPVLGGLKGRLDYTEYGGAPLLGLVKPVIKAHGSSNGNAFKNAIRQAITFHEQDVTGKIVENLAKMSGEEETGDEEQ